MIWMSTVPPPDATRTYFSRGWCSMEYGVGGLLTPGHKALDLGKLGDVDSLDDDMWFCGEIGSADFKAKIISNRCASARSPPLAPKQFNEMMDEKTEDGKNKIEFSVESDRALIKDLYETCFYSVMGNTQELVFAGLGWEFELGTLMPVLLATKNLRKLDLSFNRLRGARRCKILGGT